MAAEAEPAPAWLIAPSGAERLAGAARIFAQRGHVAVLLRPDEPALPPPLAAELAGAQAALHPQGHLVRRGVARKLAAMILDGSPADYPVLADENGAPQLAGGRLGLSFSARGEWGVVALARGRIGVDLERALPPAGLPLNLLRADERALLEGLAAPAREAWFLSLWRAKEAALKALGTGFRLPPEAVRVSGALACVEGHAQSLALLEAPAAGVTLALG